MLFSRLGLFPITLPFFNADGGGGGVGDTGGGTAQITSDGATTDAVAEPSIIDINDDALIRIKGQEKPVKFGEHVRGFQAQHTKAAQRAAQLERQLQEERSVRQRFEQQAREAAHRAQQPQQGGGQDVFAQLRALPYLTGEDAVGVVQRIAQDINQRDQVLLSALQVVKQLKDEVTRLSTSSQQAAFEQKIGKYLADGGYDPDTYGEFARELYVAHEGEDLDTEFPNILRNRIEGLQRAFQAQQAAKVAAAKKQPFVPGRGGATAPSKPLELKPDASPKDVADQLWAAFSGQSGT